METASGESREGGCPLQPTGGQAVSLRREPVPPRPGLFAYLRRRDRDQSRHPVVPHGVLRRAGGPYRAVGPSLSGGNSYAGGGRGTGEGRVAEEGRTSGSPD